MHFTCSHRTVVASSLSLLSFRYTTNLQNCDRNKKISHISTNFVQKKPPTLNQQSGGGIYGLFVENPYFDLADAD